MRDLIKNRRTLAALSRFASWAGLILGTGWLLVFVSIQQWPMALALAVLGVCVFPCWLLARHRSFSLGLLGAQIACSIFIVLFALFFDIPSTAVPRTTHLYLLVIALVGYVNLQIENSKAQLVVLALTLLTFVVLSSATMSLPIEQNLPKQMQMIRAWVNSALATVVLCGGLCVMHIGLSHSIRAELELRAALDKQEFELFYQPQVDVTGHVLGAEALLRWKHPSRGYIAPAEFLSVAEKSGLMPELGSWVIRQASHTLARWQADPTMQHLTLSINVTAGQFAIAGFVEELLEAVRKQHVEPKFLKLELTESAFLADMESVVAQMHNLRNAGFEIALDDFGTGYSSLSYLRQLPLSQLKVDRSFVACIDDNSRAATLTRNIVQIGHDLSLQVLAEGIETQTQFATMQAFGCSVFQGFLFAKPMPIDAFEHFASDRYAQATASARS